MIKHLWHVQFTCEELPTPSIPLPLTVDTLNDWSGWLRDVGLAPGTPFLLSPSFEYDVALNSYFRHPVMAGRSRATQEGYARDLAAFLSFLWSARDQVGWRDATEDDHWPTCTGGGATPTGRG